MPDVEDLDLVGLEVEDDVELGLRLVGVVTQSHSLDVSVADGQNTGFDALGDALEYDDGPRWIGNREGAKGLGIDGFGADDGDGCSTG